MSTVENGTMVVEVRGVSKRYGDRGAGGIGARRSQASVTDALDRVSLMVREGAFLGIMGPSGSGKSTLLNCLATIDVPSTGQIFVGGREISALRGKELARFRRDEVGFIFQDANLLDTLTAFENIAVALAIQKAPTGQIVARVHQAAHTLGIPDVLDRYPYQLSDGQRQRVAAARATVTNPKMVLADEPTGSLDSKAARELLESFERLNELGATIVMVTHDAVAASFCERIILIKDGRLYGELCRSGADHTAWYRQIVATVALMSEQEEAVPHAS